MATVILLRGQQLFTSFCAHQASLPGNREVPGKSRALQYLCPEARPQAAECRHMISHLAHAKHVQVSLFGGVTFT